MYIIYNFVATSHNTTVLVPHYHHDHTKVIIRLQVDYKTKLNYLNKMEAAMSLLGEEYKDYGTKFDPETYMEMNYPKVPKSSMAFADSIENEESYKRVFLLKCLADFFKWFKAPDNLKVLDYGCGPGVLQLTSAASKAAEIVLADYAQQNREFIQKWVDKEIEENRFSPYFQYVVKTLEGGSEEDAMKRQEELRSKVKAVAACDITKENIIAEGFEGPYDILLCFLVLDATSRDLESYAIGIKKLASLIKNGGHLLLYSTIREHSDIGYYTVGDIRLYDVALKRKEIIKTLERSGFSDLNSKFMPINNILYETDNNEGFFFISASYNAS